MPAKHCVLYLAGLIIHLLGSTCTPGAMTGEVRNVRASCSQTIAFYIWSVTPWWTQVKSTEKPSRDTSTQGQFMFLLCSWPSYLRFRDFCITVHMRIAVGLYSSLNIEHAEEVEGKLFRNTSFSFFLSSVIMTGRGTKAGWFLEYKYCPLAVAVAPQCWSAHFQALLYHPFARLVTPSSSHVQRDETLFLCRGDSTGLCLCCDSKAWHYPAPRSCCWCCSHQVHVYWGVRDIYVRFFILHRETQNRTIFRRKFAFGHDDLQPVSMTFNDGRNGWGASIVDGMTTMFIMGLDVNWWFSYARRSTNSDILFLTRTYSIKLSTSVVKSTSADLRWTRLSGNRTRHSFCNQLFDPFL